MTELHAIIKWNVNEIRKEMSSWRVNRVTAFAISIIGAQGRALSTEKLSFLADEECAPIVASRDDNESK